MLAISPVEALEDTRARPFQLGVHGQVVGYPGWSRALRAVAGALDRPGIILVLAAEGGGKTLFLETLTEQLAGAGLRAGLRRPGADWALDDRPIVLVDRGESLSPDEFLAMSRSNRRFVVAGTPDLGERCTDLPAVHKIVGLAPLLPGEIEAFLQQHLVLSGHPPEMLSPDAAAAIGAHAAGSPRAALTIAGLAAFLAWLEGTPRITLAHVDDAIEERTGVPRTGVPRTGPAVVVPPGVAEAPAVLTSLPPPATRVRQAISQGAERRSGRGRAVFAVMAACGLGLAAFAYTSRFNGQAAPETLPAAVSLAARDVPQPASAPPAEPAPVVAGPSANAVTVTVPVAPAAVTEPAPRAATTEPAPEATTEPAPQTAMMEPAPHAVIMEPAPPPFPPSATVSVHASIVFSRDDALGRQHAADLVRLLREGGIDVTGPDPGSPEPNDAPIAYFYAEDAGAAAEVARLIGQSGHERLATARGPPPRPGAIRVILPAGKAASLARTNLPARGTDP